MTNGRLQSSGTLLSAGKLGNTLKQSFSRTRRAQNETFCFLVCRRRIFISPSLYIHLCSLERFNTNALACYTIYTLLQTKERIGGDKMSADVYDLLKIAAEEVIAQNTKLKSELAEAREALREIWQSGDAFLPYIDNETTNRWRKAAGLEEK
jgi:hypothetical protein